MFEPQTVRQSRVTPLLWLVLIVATQALAGCNAALKLQQAQDAHERGARLENQQFIDQIKQVAGRGTAGAALVPTERPEQHYAVALKIIRDLGGAGSPGEQELAKDGLLGTKLVLEAKCHYELGHYQEAIHVARRAAGVIDPKKLPRDWVVATALPAVVINNEVYDKLRADPPITFAQAKTRLLTDNNSAMSYVKKAWSTAEGRPIEIWLRQVELILYINLEKAASQTDTEPLPLSDPVVRDYLKDQLKALEEAVETHTQDKTLAQEIADLYSDKI